VKGSHFVKVAGLTIHIADHEGIECSFQRDFDVVNGEALEDNEKHIMRMIDYPRLCKKTVIAKHLGLTIPKLKELLGKWGLRACKAGRESSGGLFANGHRQDRFAVCRAKRHKCTHPRATGKYHQMDHGQDF
jgi:hypothetical protein